MYLLCILPFLARQFIPVYFKRIVREKAKAAEVDRISPVPLHFVTKLYTNRSYDFILNGNTLRIAFFFVIIPFLESSITRIVSVKLVKHFSNRRRRGRHMHARARAHTHTFLFLRVRKGKVRRRWPTSRNDTSGEIYIISKQGYRRTGSRIKARISWTAALVQKFRFPRWPAAIHPVARRSRWLV